MTATKPNRRRLRMVLTGCLFALLLFTMVPRATSIYQLSARKQVLLQEKARLTEINAEREQTLAAIDTPTGMERIAREQLGMIKPGEQTIVRVINSQ